MGEGQSGVQLQTQQQQDAEAAPVMDHKRRLLKVLPLAAIRRPLGGTRKNGGSRRLTILQAL